MSSFKNISEEIDLDQIVIGTLKKEMAMAIS